MTGSNSTTLSRISESQGPTEYFCSRKQGDTWILTDTTTFTASIVTSAVACPLTVLLNILVIFAVKTRKELQKNSNILLVSLAVSDLLVGAISMPLSITRDAFLLKRKFGVTGVSICRIALANDLVLCTSACCSLYHMTGIAWERQRAVRKWWNYKLIVTKKRVVCCVVISWLLSFLKTVLARGLIRAGVNYRYVKIVQFIVSLNVPFGLALIGYFYLMANIAVRRRKLNNMRGIAAQARQRMERNIAKTTAILTFALLISYLPSVVVVFASTKMPILREISVFRWTELLTQLNSLANPLLYCLILNRHFKIEVVKTLKGEYEDLRQFQLSFRRSSRSRRPEVLHDFQDFKGEKIQGDHPEKFESCDAFLANYARCQEPRIIMKEVYANSSDSTSSDAIKLVICVDIHQPKPIRWKLPKEAAAKYDQSQCSLKDTCSVPCDGKNIRLMSKKRNQEDVQVPEQEYRTKRSNESEDTNDFKELSEGTEDYRGKTSASGVFMIHDDDSPHEPIFCPLFSTTEAYQGWENHIKARDGIILTFQKLKCDTCQI